MDEAFRRRGLPWHTQHSSPNPAFASGGEAGHQLEGVEGLVELRLSPDKREALLGHDTTRHDTGVARGSEHGST